MGHSRRVLNAVNLLDDQSKVLWNEVKRMACISDF